MLWLEVSCNGDLNTYKEEFLKKEGAYFEIGRKCYCEEKIRAFMRMIRVAEGTGEYFKGTRTSRDPQLGYTTWYTGQGNNFTDLSTHPKTINCNEKKTLCSSAAGAYQFMSWKFDELNGYKVIWNGSFFETKEPKEYTESLDYAKKYNAKGFSQESQDRLCLIILKDIGVIDKLLSNQIEEAIDKAKGTWVSLPGATAGQPTAKMKDTLEYYEEFLEKEKSNDTNLHIKPGFLKEFGLQCDCDNDDCDGSWHDPVDNPRITKYNYGGTEKPASGAYGYARRKTDGSKKYHSGFDFFAMPGKDKVYSCLNGRLMEVTKSSLAGWIVRIKIDNVNELLEQEKKVNYSLMFNDESKGVDIKEGDDAYLIYMHLHSVNYTEADVGKSISSGTVIGLAGVSGSIASGGRAPHLHMEISKVVNPYGTGEKNRTNPARFVKLNSYNTKDQDDASKSKHYE